MLTYLHLMKILREYIRNKEINEELDVTVICAIMEVILTTRLHCGPFRCRSISYIVWLFGLSGSVVFVVG